MRIFSLWLLAGAAALPLAAPAAASAQPYRFHYDHVLGTSLDLTVVAPSRAAALIGADAARQEIVRLDTLLSGWRADSELERLNRSDEARVSPELYEVLSRAEHWRVATGGAFDCRVGASLALWREAEANAVPIDAARLETAIAAQRQDVRFEPAQRIVHRPEGVRFAVDGVAKGYVIDAAMAAARKASPDLRGLMIDIGGDLRCWGQAPQAAGWSVGVAATGDADNIRPAVTLRLADQAVAASGRGARDLTIGGASVSHTLSPASGQPVAHVQKAVVVAKSAADADALATAFMVMAPHEAVALADRLDGVESLVTDGAGVDHTSRGWRDLQQSEGQPRLIRASLATSATAAAAAPAAARSAGLDLTYDVPKIDASPYHAPYVVMWLTDENRTMVRFSSVSHITT